MVSITFKPALKSLPGNSKSRYKARRREKQEMQRNEAALQRRIEEAVAGCSIKVVRAVSAPSMREQHTGSVCMPDVSIYRAGYRSVRNGATHIIKG